MSSGSDTPARLACQIRICWRWEGRGSRCGTVPVTGPAAAPPMGFPGTSCALGGTRLTLSTAHGRPGHPGPSAAVTAAGAFGTGNAFATTRSPSTEGCRAWARRWSTRSATSCPAQWMVRGRAGRPGHSAQRHVVVDTT